MKVQIEIDFTLPEGRDWRLFDRKGWDIAAEYLTNMLETYLKKAKNSVASGKKPKYALVQAYYQFEKDVLYSEKVDKYGASDPVPCQVAQAAFKRFGAQVYGIEIDPFKC
jgi:hypothetical protein